MTVRPDGSQIPYEGVIETPTIIPNLEPTRQATAGEHTSFFILSKSSELVSYGDNSSLQLCNNDDLQWSVIFTLNKTVVGLTKFGKAYFWGDLQRMLFKH